MLSDDGSYDGDRSGLKKTGGGAATKEGRGGDGGPTMADSGKSVAGDTDAGRRRDGRAARGR